MSDLRFDPRLCYCARFKLRALSIRAEVAHRLGMSLLVEVVTLAMAGEIVDAIGGSA
jgi:hypothetical protein